MEFGRVLTGGSGDADFAPHGNTQIPTALDRGGPVQAEMRDGRAGDLVTIL